jgi:hypothetical protein
MPGAAFAVVSAEGALAPLVDFSINLVPVPLDGGDLIPGSAHEIDAFKVTADHVRHVRRSNAFLHVKLKKTAIT